MRITSVKCIYSLSVEWSYQEEEGEGDLLLILLHGSEVGEEERKRETIKVTCPDLNYYFYFNSLDEIPF